MTEYVAAMLDQPQSVDTPETLTGPKAEIITKAPPGGEDAHKLSIYFVLHRREIVPESNNSADELPVGDPATFTLRHFVRSTGSPKRRIGWMDISG